MHEHDQGEAATTAGGATAKDAATAPTPAEQVVLAAAGDPHAFAHALAALETNTDVDDPRKPLSHAGLVMHYLQGTWPA